jgi:hypothetical protein
LLGVGLWGSLMVSISSKATFGRPSGPSYPT